MDENNNHIEIFEQYVGGKMSTEARRAFEADLLINPELKEEFEIFQRLSSGFQDIKADKVRVKLKQIDQDLDRQPKAGKVIPIKFWLAAAAILVLAILSYRYLTIFKNDNTFQVSYIPLEEGLPVTMSAMSEKEFDDAMSSFKAEEYDAALTAFTKLSFKVPENDTVSYFLANSLLRTGQFEKAESEFLKVAVDSTSEFRQKAEFYHALCLWAMGDLITAKAILSEIAQSSDHPFVNEAAQLIAKIDSAN